MKTKRYLTLLIIFNLLAMMCFAQQLQLADAASGVKKISFGVPDKFSPYSFCAAPPDSKALLNLPAGSIPFKVGDIRIHVTGRGTVVEIPLQDSEQLYGFGMQIGSFNQRGLRKRPIVNDNPLNDVGYSHAPMPYYVSTGGYGILINTSRYTTFYCGTTEKVKGGLTSNGPKNAQSTNELYSNNAAGSYVTIDIPGAKGAEIFVFEGPDLRTAIQRYNLFSGGGVIPPLWALGVKYRVKADFNAGQVYKMANYFRDNQIPCDVLGLEPQWQTAAYSCSYVWNNKLFPNPQNLIDSLKNNNFHINLWEHAFVNEKSPLYSPLKNASGNYAVWNGLVPDFAAENTRNQFAAYHKTTFADKGISGFKLDECDNSNLTTGDATWSFPELSEFPSGIDGEQMHQLFGLLYQKTMLKMFRENNTRTLLDVRSSNAFASSYAASLYSDIYGHQNYIQMIPNAGFSGLLWSPEVRESSSSTELLRRTQTAVLSAQTLFNSWYLQNPPWLQFDKQKNNRNEFMADAKEVEATVKQLLNFRMSFIPYLYNAFAQYKFKGVPPFRALVVDYPADKNVYNIDNEYMIGESVLAAPLTGDANQRKVYLPAGNWYDYNTDQKYAGGKEYTITNKVDQLPIFIKEGAILPLAKPVQFTNAATVFDVDCKVYGANAKTANLFEDDGLSFNFEKGAYNTISLSWENGKGKIKRSGNYKQIRYRIKSWSKIN
ncbi:TIM-barrel domain-containing protein [Mucilaginibacter lutimaris]|uniref:TIM-barrel domain-containing protein n=1 Tax=Mucilaginibacter lutimaris TaxID=931629 RepID=A0ABW2ZBR6_9SPHI